MKSFLMTVLFLAVHCFGQQPKLVLVEGGEFMMGDSTGYNNEKPRHKVLISSFHIGQYEVTAAEFKTYLKDISETTNLILENEKYGDSLAAYCSWNDAISYCRWLTSKTGEIFRLPTEAEWEYAARGGMKSRRYKYSGSDSLEEVAWFQRGIITFSQSSEKVGSLKPNELDIYDMSGNVWEWCQDWYDEKYYEESPVDNPTGPPTGFLKVIRGGANNTKKEDMSVSIRFSGNHLTRFGNTGFRVVRMP